MVALLRFFAQGLGDHTDKRFGNLPAELIERQRFAVEDLGRGSG